MLYGTVSRNRYSMALSLVGGLYFALASLQVAGASQVNINVNPTTGYAEVGPRTYSVPSNARTTAGTGVPSVSVMPDGRFRQSFPSGIEITAIKNPGAKGFSNVGGGVAATAQAVKNAAARCVTSLKCNLAFAAGAAGFEAFLDGVDWVMGPGAEITKNEAVLSPGGEPGAYYWAPTQSSPARGSTPEAACLAIAAGNTGPSVRFTYQSVFQSKPTQWTCTLKRESLSGGVWTVSGYPEYALNRFGSSCPAGSTWTPALGACVISYQEVAVPPSEIEQKIQADYVPHPDDWRFILPGLDLGSPFVSIDVSPPPSPAAESAPSVTEYPDGSSSETSTQWDLDWLDNGTHQPRLEITETTVKNDYSPTGAPTGSTTTVDTAIGPGAGQQPIPPSPEVPTDCDFMPTVCSFIDWVKDPGDGSPDPYDDLEQLVQVYEDPGITVVVGPFNATCPAPRVVEISFIPSLEISYQPFCDFASMIRLWFLALCYLGAAYVTVRSV